MNAPVCGTGDDLGPVVGERKAYGDIRQVDTAGSLSRWNHVRVKETMAETQERSMHKKTNLATHDEYYLLALVAVNEGAGFVTGRREACSGAANAFSRRHSLKTRTNTRSTHAYTRPGTFCLTALSW